MALGNCRECNNQVAKSAKVCPHCGVKKPYRKPRESWAEIPTWRKVVGIAFWVSILVVFVSIYSKREERLLEQVTALEQADYKGKYEGYSKLYDINSTNSEYSRKAIEYGKAYLKTIPVTEARENLKAYERLAELDSSSDYKEKIALYSFMVDISWDCEETAHKMSRRLLNNPSTFESNVVGTGGGWLSQNRYGYVHRFEGANAFGVKTTFVAEYICNTNPDTRKYSVQRMSISRE